MIHTIDTSFLTPKGAWKDDKIANLKAQILPGVIITFENRSRLSQEQLNAFILLINANAALDPTLAPPNSNCVQIDTAVPKPVLVEGRVQILNEPPFICPIPPQSNREAVLPQDLLSIVGSYLKSEELFNAIPG